MRVVSTVLIALMTTSPAWSMSFWGQLYIQPAWAQLAANNTFTGTNTFSGRILLGDGLVSAPSLSFTSCATCGLYRDSVLGDMVIAAGGVPALVVRPSATVFRIKSDFIFGWASGDPTSTGEDTILGRDSAASLQAGKDAATAISQSIKAHDGLGTDKTGADIGLYGGNGTGTASGGNLILWTTPEGAATGSSQNAPVPRHVQMAARKNLTESAATTMARVSVPSGGDAGGKIDYTVFATDGTDYQLRSGTVYFQVVNKAGTETCVVSGYDGTVNPAETKDGSSPALSAGAGTLTYTWGVDVATPTNGCDLTLNAVSSLTQTALYLRAATTMHGSTGVSLTPQ